ncbi:hypothetical protein [Flavivirga jejuensis]|uniref:Uncharacterized protein n=1 Tax=Flavivirga jejuensis TaxID=870487 RepID=A0ABT8WSU7_9FLAO|nr:hypothetical protein [Flavivirga jejuensis]MDO5976236.1 hypothetical protein [Flavivirga jejuensis]
MRNIIYILCICVFSNTILGQVKYDQGRITVDKVQLLQDYKDSLAYYYIPQHPRLAINEKGDFEFLCMKYVGKEEKDNGGLFHALFEFSMEEKKLKKLEKQLQAKIKDAKIKGPVPLLETMKDGEPSLGSFRVISSILTDTLAENPFTQNLITSGRAPFTPGSKAVLAAKLSQEGSTLLWKTFNGAASDVSVAVSGYYEGVVQAYNAVVTAEMDMVYDHFSNVSKTETLFTHDEVSNAIDSLYSSGVIKIETLDRTKGLGVKSDLKNILQIVSDKLINLMFDTETGWSAEPEMQTPAETKDKSGKGVLSGFAFGPASMFIPDIQHIVKKRKDIKARRFRLDLSESTTIKVPFHTAGNLGGLYDSFRNDPKYFRVVDLESSDFEKQEVIFQLDGEFVESFEDLVNFVSVNFRKKYDKERDDFTHQLYFNSEDIKAGKFYKSISFPRLGISDNNWQEYEYQISWSIRGESDFVGKKNTWIKARDKAIVIAPPFKKIEVAIDLDKQLLIENEIATVAIDFAADFLGKTRLVKSVTLRASGQENNKVASIFYDHQGEVVYRTVWYAKNGDEIKLPHKPLERGYLFLTPPSKQNDIND